MKELVQTNKKISVITMVLIAFTCFSQKPTALQWETKTYDFGKITKGQPVTATFNFKNNGDSPLLISEVKTTCGCTVASYPKEAIAPGKEGTIVATYNASKPGAFNKSLKVLANVDQGMVVLKLKGEINK